MYLDFDDRPDIPRVPQAVSLREGILLSIIVHMAFVIALLLAPEEWLRPSPAEMPGAEEQEPLRYVEVLPMIDRQLLPNPESTRSEFDLRGAPDPVPAPAPPTPRTAGPEVPPAEVAAGPDAADPAPGPLTGIGDVPPPPEPPRTQRAAGSLGDAFRNLQRYLDTPQVGGPAFNDGQSGADVEMRDSQGRPIEGIDFGPWMRRFAAQIRRNWLIPQVAERSRGRVVVTFTVLRSGALIDLSVKQPATIDALTSAAVTALKLSNPTSALPAEYFDDRVLFTVTFHYNEPIRDRP